MDEETKNKSDPYLVEIINFIENEDGSADIDFLLGPEALKRFASIGIIASLKDAVKDLKNEFLHEHDGEVR